MAIGAGIGMATSQTSQILAGRATRRLQRKQKSFRKLQSAERLASIGRRREALLERHARVTVPGLVQSMAGRGLARSTIATEALEAADRARDRALADFAAQERLENKSYNLFRAELKYNRKMAYLGGVQSAGHGIGQVVTSYEQSQQQ